VSPPGRIPNQRRDSIVRRPVTLDTGWEADGDIGHVPSGVHAVEEGRDRIEAVPHRVDTIPTLFDGVQSRGKMHYIPIRLTAGVERDRVVDDAVAQMIRIADKLRDFSGPRQ